MGAVMGSKNLKAVAVRGNQKPAIADKEALTELGRWGFKAFPSSGVTGLGKYGTAGVVSVQQTMGGLPTFNFRSGVFDGWKTIDGPTIYEAVLKGRETGKQDQEGRDTCFGCLIRCKRVVEINEGPYQVDPLYGGPEYETVATLGSYCGVNDLTATCKANEICNKYGLDTISCGATIAWAMEAFEARAITSNETGGLDLEFGNAEAMVKLTEMIGRREGFGDILAEGSARASQRLGRGAEFLITAKNQEAPAHMPQVKRSLALIYAVNPFGADHMSSDHDPSYEEGFENFKKRLEVLGLTQPQKPRSLGPEKVNFARKTQHFYSLLDSLNLCQFACGPSWQLYGPVEIVKMLQAVTGWDVTIEELLAVGERRLNMMRAFNAREGINRNQDTLSEKFFEKTLKGGPSDGWKIDRVEWEAARDEYYRQCGWDVKSGEPTRHVLDRLNLG